MTDWYPREFGVRLGNDIVSREFRLRWRTDWYSR